jgi:cellulose synthase/poly-beta-1,6-N-acetylglucosamine synthase-like glycosyltransferase
MNWLNILLVPIAIIYLLVVMVLFTYGINFFHLSWHAWKHRGSLNSAAHPSPKEFPRVTVQLPVYNERYVARRLVEAAAALNYPSHLFEIQVLDDSTDDTKEIIEEVTRQLLTQGINIQHIHRTKRTGFKAGALAEGLRRSSGEFIAIFDADFIPEPDFIQRVLPYFETERVAFVQARWGHLNRDYSILTFLQSLSIDAHFAVEQLARSTLGYWFNFNGTAGIWRKTAIEDAGGWKAETLTEDLDLSYRAFLRGWEARYAAGIIAPAELPVSMTAYRRQQHRWARGSLECAIRYVPVVWQMEIPLARKIEATLHLSGYCVHLLLFALSILYPLVLLLSVQYPTLISLFGIAVLFNFTALAPTTFFAVAQFSMGKKWVRSLPSIFFMTVLGAGMMLNTVRAALQIGTRKQAAFERTPKYGITKRDQAWSNKQYYVKVDGIIYFEICAVLLNAWTVYLSFQLGNHLIGIYAAMFAIGLSFVILFSVIQSIPGWRLRKSEQNP